MIDTLFSASKIGHGKGIKDRLGFENDGKDEALVPVDAQELYNDVIFGGKTRRERLSLIVDDDILRLLVKPLKAGVVLTCVVDSCHSGTVLDLPYRYTGHGDEMERDFGFDFQRFAIRGLGALGIAAAIVTGLVCSLME